MERSRLALRTLLLLLVVPAARSSPALEYTITDLGTLGVQPYNVCYAMDINDAGQVIGVAERDDRTMSLFLWDAQNGMRDLEIPMDSREDLCSLNNAGQIVGTSPEIGAFLWNGPTDVRQLLSPSGGDAGAAAINDLGAVAGQATVYGRLPQACFWDPDGNPQLVPTPGDLMSCAYDINNAGQLVGVTWADSSGRGALAFAWDETNGLQDLGTLGRDWSVAQANNNAGEVVGWVGNGDHDLLGFIWDADNGMRPLESAEGALSGGLDINDASQVLGGAQLWKDGAFVDLSEEVGRPAGWWFSRLRAINNLGQIVGWGYSPDDKPRAFLLTPVPEPTAVGLLFSGLLALGVLARRRARASG